MSVDDQTSTVCVLHFKRLGFISASLFGSLERLSHCDKHSLTHWHTNTQHTQTAREQERETEIRKRLEQMTMSDERVELRCQTITVLPSFCHHWSITAYQVFSLMGP